MLQRTTKILSRNVLINYRTLFIRSESTPNPHSLKYLPGRNVLPEAFGTGINILRTDLNAVKRSPLAKSIFTIKGVKGVFIGPDFITVTKDFEENWSYLRNLVYSQIFKFFESGEEVYLAKVDGESEIKDTTILDTDDEVVASIKELFEDRIRPSVQEDGGDIFYEGFDPLTGIVKVRLAGSCVGCPSSSVTLRNGVENMLKHYIKEVTGIEEVPATDVNEEDNKLSFKPDDVSVTAAA